MKREPARPVRRRKPRPGLSPGPSMDASPPCPTCGSRQVIPIVYGLPTPGDHVSSAQGRIELAGCVLPDVAPAWRCRGCQAGFGSAFSDDRLG
jgi:hypothetical protein